MRISKNFTLLELTKSNTATRLGISNTPDKEGIHKLRLLATELLQPLRNAVGPLRVTSGYRSESLNKAIGVLISHNILNARLWTYSLLSVAVWTI